MSRLAGVYVILDAEITPDLPALAEAVVRAGVRLLQYRAKRGVDGLVLERLAALARTYRALLIVNDDYDAARRADGVHLGQEDLQSVSIAVLRRRLSGKMIGCSIHRPEHLESLCGVDYLGIGPVHATTTKRIDRAPLGVSGLADLCGRTALPVAAIGGLQRDDIPAVAAAGAAMVAVIGAIAHAADPFAEAAAFCRAWDLAVSRPVQ